MYVTPWRNTLLFDIVRFCNFGAIINNLLDREPVFSERSWAIIASTYFPVVDCESVDRNKRPE